MRPFPMDSSPASKDGGDLYIKGGRALLKGGRGECSAGPKRGGDRKEKGKQSHALFLKEREIKK